MAALEKARTAAAGDPDLLAQVAPAAALCRSGQCEEARPYLERAYEASGHGLEAGHQLALALEAVGRDGAPHWRLNCNGDKTNDVVFEETSRRALISTDRQSCLVDLASRALLGTGPSAGYQPWLTGFTWRGDLVAIGGAIRPEGAPSSACFGTDWRIDKLVPEAAGGKAMPPIPWDGLIAVWHQDSAVVYDDQGARLWSVPGIPMDVIGGYLLVGQESEKQLLDRVGQVVATYPRDCSPTADRKAIICGSERRLKLYGLP
jgi:hypothetical protein